ncbi:MAG: DUF2949 domain-containing protein [Spirulinaceae cyanobacterium RM2_2_10]|nr:DUF2949 domain-containing protein [Spirulinaceae cyanobacterium SM2_1_0]NJO18830.1 DUF2949 domain-containing protein [Spirulinaceae cyanobacterium RM2_2_10]
MPSVTYAQFIQFLKSELSLSADSIKVAQRHLDQNPGPLAMMLWQYGLVTLDQLDQIFDWLEGQNA